MEKRMSNMGFRLRAIEFKLRNLLRPRKDIVKEVGIKAGDRVLDYGCGPGGYIPALEDLVGESGKIYALDVQPLALQMVQSMAAKKRLKNVETILSDCKTGLPDVSIDAVLLYDILHDLDNPRCVLEELYRVLKADGVLSLSDHHLKEDEIISRVTAGGLFKVVKKGIKTVSFGK
jgi:ubiquinone/menaquinone biosynthesis C-methylase UbiE